MTANRTRSETTGDGSTGVSASRRSVLTGSGAVGLAALSGCLGANGGVVFGKRDESESTFDLPEGLLRVDAEHGDVTVRRGSGDSVRVHTEKTGSLLSSLSDVTVDARREGDTVVVENRATGDGGLLSERPDVTVDVEIPTGVRLDAFDHRNGRARVEGVSVTPGTRVRTQNGRAVVERTDGDVEVVTSNGVAIARDVAGFVRAESTNGGVTIERCDGVDGAATTNGSVTADVTGLRGDATLESSNGNVEVALSPVLDARVIAETNTGSVTVEAPMSLETETDTYVEGTLGDGTHELRLTTTNGSVTVDSLPQ